MKRVIGVVVAVAICGLFWVGCQKKEAGPEGMKAPEAKPAPMAAPAVPPPPPPPPPAPAPAEQQGGGQ